MSFDFRTVREPSNDPVLKYITSLQKQMSKVLTKDQIDQLEGAEDIFGDVTDTDSAIKFQTNLNSLNLFTFDKQYYPPFEPDHGKLRLWLLGGNLGAYLKDYSTFDRTCSILGDPILVDGSPFDSGIHTSGTKSIALRFNRPTSIVEGTECIQVDATSTTTLGVASRVTGKSYFARVRLFDLSTQEGFSRTIFEKIDDSTPNDAAALIVTQDGRLRFYIKRAGTFYNAQTATGTITTDTVYDIWCTYAVSGNVQHIYVNNVDKSLTDPGNPNLQSDLTNNDLWIFQRGAGTDAGFVYGDLYDFRIYDEKVVSGTEVGYFNTNKWSISDIPFGQVMIAGYWATYDEDTGMGSGGYDSTGYDSTGYDTS